MSVVDFIKTPKMITLIVKRGNPIVLQSDHENFGNISALLLQGKLDEALALADLKTPIKLANSKFKFSDQEGCIVIDGEVLPKALSERLIQFVKDQLDTAPLEAFWRRLRKNPSDSSKQSLYTFLEKNKIPITEDGHFIAYKRVRSDFLDIHSSKFDNSPGKTVEMPRDKVNPDTNTTCSTGLHVAAFGYAKHYYHSGEGHILEVKVDPKDVVAVPYDYNAQKMRVCRYKVLNVYEAEHEIEDKVYTKGPRKRLAKKVKLGRKIPADFKNLFSDGKGDINIPNALLRLIGMDIGDKAYIYVADKRSRCVIVSATMPDKSTKMTEAEISHRSIKVRYGMLTQAKIDGDSFTASLEQGNLVIRESR